MLCVVGMGQRVQDHVNACHPPHHVKFFGTKSLKERRRYRLQIDNDEKFSHSILHLHFPPKKEEVDQTDDA